MATFGLGVRYELFETRPTGTVLGPNDLPGLLAAGASSNILIYQPTPGRIAEVFIRHFAVLNPTGTYNAQLNIFNKRMDTGAYVQNIVNGSVISVSVSGGIGFSGYFLNQPTVLNASRGYGISPAGSTYSGSFLLYDEEQLRFSSSSGPTGYYWSAVIREYIS